MKDLLKYHILIVVILIFSIICNSNELSKEIPEAQIILPIRRKGTSQSKLNEGPCGGIERKKANTLTMSGSVLNVVWETISPVKSGNCTVSLSYGFENQENFTVLFPKDNHNPDGSFICGGKTGFESKSFQLDEIECENCILQWKWSTQSGIYYSCSDMIINGTKLGACLSKCQNKGQCVNGKCVCINGFIGEFCQYKPSTNILRILIFILFGIIALGLIAGIIYLIITSRKNRKWTNNEELKKDPIFENSSYIEES